MGENLGFESEQPHHHGMDGGMMGLEMMHYRLSLTSEDSSEYDLTSFSSAGDITLSAPQNYNVYQPCLKISYGNRFLA